MFKNKGRMKCPGCAGGTLERRRVIASSSGDEVELDRCRYCQGVWYDAGELHQLIALADENVTIPRKANPAQWPCPKCNGKLFDFNYPQTYVPIEACKRCGGIWIGKDELREIYMVRHHLQQKAQHPTLNDALVALYESIEQD